MTDFIPLKERRVRNALSGLGEDIRVWRKIRRLTRAQVATTTGVSVSTISRLEAGDPGVSIGALTRVVHALHISDPFTSLSPHYNAEGQRLLIAALDSQKETRE